MRFTFFILTSLSLIANVAAAEYHRFHLWGDGYLQVRSCSLALFSSATFCNRQGYFTYWCFCQNEAAMASMSGCIKTLKLDHDKAFDWLTNYCNGRKIPFSSQNITESLEYLEKNGKNYTYVPHNETHPTKINFPIYVNQTLAYVYYEAYKNFFGNSNWAYWFSNIIYAYWALVFLIAALCNWLVVIFPNMRNFFNGRVSKAWRKYVTLPALVRRKKTNHQHFFGILNFLVPTRLESIIIFGFFWVTFICNALCYHWVAGDPVFGSKYNAFLRYVADRSGIIGTLLLPLLILTGGRNNFLQWVTRWKFSTFITYHRWIGRVILALFFVHSIAFTCIFINNGNYAESMKEKNATFGTAGTVIMVLLCVQGLLVLRREFYEIFLVIHIILAITFIIVTWAHLKMRLHMDWIFASIAIWSFDRFARLVRMSSFGAPKASVTLLSDDCLRVEVKKPRYWPSVPGGYAWVYFGHSWYFWQSHPFSFLDSTIEENKIVFILKAKKGITNHLKEKLNGAPGKTCTIRVCVEGPYGGSNHVKKHDNVVFVAGGNGISGIFSECYALAKKSAENSKQKIKLIWVLREFQTLEWIWKELDALKNTKINATIYITRPEVGDVSVILGHLEAKEDSSLDEKDLVSNDTEDIVDLLRTNFPHVRFETGRPLMENIVDEETEEASGSAAFITCGHPIMVDDLRYAVVKKIDNTEKRVDFFEQLQVWA